MIDTIESDPERPRISNRAGGKSSVLRLAPDVREAVDRAIREERATLDEIVAMVNELGGTVSRSAVGRYSHKARVRLEQFSEAREIAEVWVGRLEEDPAGDVGRLVTEMLRTVAFQQVGAMGDSEEPLKVSETMMLARAIQGSGECR